MNSNLDSRLAKLEQRTVVNEVCTLCAERSARAEAREAETDGLVVVESWTIEMPCPSCARSFAIQVDYVESVDHHILRSLHNL
jgi:hypothetical protein